MVSDPFDAFDPANDPTTSPFPYGHGFQQTSSFPSWRTIMAYDCVGGCPRLQYWSNPNVNYNGIPMGTVSTNDNARVLNETAATVAAFGRKSTSPGASPGQLLSYRDVGSPGNVSDPVIVGFGGWSPFKFLFAGKNAAGEDRIYAVDQQGQLLSYGDAGSPGNVSDPVVVGFGGWSQFKFLFAGKNAAGEDRIYAVTP